MADDIDLAQERDAAYREAALARRVVILQDTFSSGDCQDCDEPIPEARRAILPGATRCTRCQFIFDQKEARGR
jgi:phage/conjugal plasmid C-4 type zinc finger TraR family protein